MAKTTRTPGADTPAPVLAIGMLVKNRAWALPDVLGCIAAQVWPAKAQVAVHLLDDGSTDGSAAMLTAWADANRADYHSITVDRRAGIAANESSRDFPGNRHDLFRYLVDLRNVQLAWAREIGAMHYLEFDSDTLLAPTMARDVAALGVPWASTMITCETGGASLLPTPGQPVNVYNMGSEHTLIWPSPHSYTFGGPPVVMDGTGAAHMLSGAMLANPAIAYTFHVFGEHPGLATMAHPHGIRAYCLPGPLAIHVMASGRMAEAVALAASLWGPQDVTPQGDDSPAPTETTEGAGDD